MGKYDDIISLEVPTSKNHKRMSMNNRAAQFAPFAALVGYAEAINSSKDNSDTRKVIGEDKKQEIEGLLHEISRDLSRNWIVKVTYYSKNIDTGKYKYVTYQGKVKKIDINNKKIIFTNRLSISIKDIYDLELLEDEH